MGKYANDELKNNEAIVMTALQHDWRAFEYADEKMKNNETFVMAALQKDGRVLKYVGAEMKNNEAIVMAAIKNQNGQGTIILTMTLRMTVGSQSSNTQAK